MCKSANEIKPTTLMILFSSASVDLTSRSCTFFLRFQVKKRVFRTRDKGCSVKSKKKSGAVLSKSFVGTSSPCNDTPDHWYVRNSVLPPRLPPEAIFQVDFIYLSIIWGNGGNWNGEEGLGGWQQQSKRSRRTGWSVLPSPLSRLSRFVSFLLVARMQQDETSAEFLKLWFIVPCAPPSWLWD